MLHLAVQGAKTKLQEALPGRNRVTDTAAAAGSKRSGQSRVDAPGVFDLPTPGSCHL